MLSSLACQRMWCLAYSSLCMRGACLSADTWVLSRAGRACYRSATRLHYIPCHVMSCHAMQRHVASEDSNKCSGEERT